MPNQPSPEHSSTVVNNADLFLATVLSSQDHESDPDFSQQFRNDTGHDPDENYDCSEISDSSSEQEHHDLPIDTELFGFQLPPLLPDMMYTTSEDANSNLFSSLFEDDSQFIDDLGEVVNYEAAEHCEDVSNEDNCGSDNRENIEQASNSRGGDHIGLSDWKYCLSHRETSIDIDRVDETLGTQFVRTANAVLDRVLSELAEDSCSDVSRLDIIQSFLPQSILQHLTSHSNRILRKKSKPLTSPNELLGLLVLHILCASYGKSPSTVLLRKETKCFLQLDIKAARYREIWATFSCTTRTRQRVLSNEDNLEWQVMPEDANQLLLWMERSIADVNRIFIALNGAKIYSLDDDHLRQSSKTVTEMSDLQSVNNPAKALGPVQNAICCPLTGMYIAGHFTRKGDKLDDIWEVLSTRVQGAPNRGSLKRNADVIYAADRGYNCGKTTHFVSEFLGATLLGTHKRSLDYPFVFGEVPIAKKHKGVSVLEKGSRIVYSAVKRNSSPSSGAIEAFLYRESVGGRIAAMIHNNNRLFGSEKYTVVPRNGYRSLDHKNI